MDFPASIQEWWIYLIPGGYVLTQIFFLYDGITHLFAYSNKFLIGSMLKTIQDYSIPVLLGGAVLSLLIGSVVDSFSFGLFSKLRRKNFFQKRLEELTKTYRLSEWGHLPSEMKKVIDNPTDQQAEDILEILETHVYENAKEKSIETVQETQVARAFTENFFIAYASTVFSVVWAIGRQRYDFLSLALALLCLGMFYLWRESASLSKAYYKKVVRVATATA